MQVRAHRRPLTFAAMPLLLEIYDPDAARPHRSTSPYYAHHPAQSHSSNTLPYEPRRRKPFEPRWDPSQLSYSPRMMPPRTTPHPSTFAPPPEPSPWPGPQQMQQLSDDFDRLTERGMAKFGSALSSLRQKAEAAMRNREGARTLFRPQSASTDPLNPHAAQASSWDPFPSTQKSPYDHDPHVVSESQLDELAPSPLSSKDDKTAPPLPQHPAQTSSTDHCSAPSSQASAADTTEDRPSKSAHTLHGSDHATSHDAPEPSKNSSPKEPASSEPKSSATDDEEYIDNPFDDDD